MNSQLVHSVSKSARIDPKHFSSSSFSVHFPFCHFQYSTDVLGCDLIELERCILGFNVNQLLIVWLSPSEIIKNQRLPFTQN